jgi:hypothetical protein
MAMNRHNIDSHTCALSRRIADLTESIMVAIMSEIDDVENRGASTGELRQLNLVISSAKFRYK